MARAESSAPVSDPVAERVNTLLAAMTLEQKVGQLFLVAFYGSHLSPALKRMIANHHIGGIVMFNITNNIVNAAQAAKLINDAQAQATSNGARIPLFIATDQEGGKVSRMPPSAVRFPSQMALGATDSENHARLMARITATELKALGINMNLAPVLDVNDNPLNPVIGTRSFSSDPERVARLGAAMVAEYKAQNILATAKHFPGHGNTELDSHFALPVISRTAEMFEAVDLLPFQRVMSAGLDAVMTAHIVFPQLDANAPATLSPTILQDLLRQKLGYGGLIVSDSLLMSALGKNLNETVVRAFKAGVDVLAVGADLGYTRLAQRTTYQALLEAVQADPALQGRLDQSVRRILTTKARYGILDWKSLDHKQTVSVLGHEQHRAVARQIAQDSVTLIRDDQKLVPLSAEATSSVLLVLPFGAGNLAAPVRGCHAKTAVVRTRADPTVAEVSRIVKQSARHDVTVVATMNVNANKNQAKLVKALLTLGKPLVVVALQSPYDLMSFPEVGTYLTAYSDVPASLEALANVLCGKVAPKGKLPVDLFR